MNSETSLSLFVLLIAGIGVALLITCVPVPAGEVCLTHRQARHLWPTRHLWWYNDDGDKCWSNRHGGPPRGLKIEPERKKEKKLRTDPIFPPRAEAKTAANPTGPKVEAPLRSDEPLRIITDDCCWPQLTEFDLRWGGLPVKQEE